MAYPHAGQDWAHAYPPEASRRTGDGQGRNDPRQHPPQQVSEGPAAAASFYSNGLAQESQASASSLQHGNVVVGTGTDGFGAGLEDVSASHVAQPMPPVYVETPDYRHMYRRPPQERPSMSSSTSHRTIPPQYNAGPGPSPSRGIQHQQPYIESQYVPSSAYLAHPDGTDRETAYSHNVEPQQSLYAYPPSPSNQVERRYGSEPSGIYKDRAPDYEKLNDEQREIADSFPKDLDEEGGSMLKKIKTKALDWRSWLKWRYVHYYIIIIVIVAILALMTIYHKKIIDWLTPISKKARSLAWGWVIPVVVLFIISFPPLFGHEIVGVLCGVVYGLWIGFGILSLGTLLGELGNFIAFRFFLLKHAARAERKSIDYACMAHIVREGGFLVILLARLSAIPGHFTTAVFATVGMNLFIFTLAAILSLPKQLVVVYLGVAIEASGDGQESTKSKIIKYVVLFVSTLVTILVALYLYHKMQKARPIVQARMREKRYQLLVEAGERGNHGTSASPFASDDSSNMLQPKNESITSATAPYYGQGNLDVRSTDRLASPTTSKSVLEMDEHEDRKGRRGMWARMTGRGNSKTQREQQHPVNRSPSHRAVYIDGARASFESDSLAHENMLSTATTPTGVPFVRPQDQTPVGMGSDQMDFSQRMSRNGLNPGAHAYPLSVDSTHRDHRDTGNTVMSPFDQRLAPLPSSGERLVLPPTQRRYRHVDNIGSVYDVPSEASGQWPEQRRSPPRNQMEQQSRSIWREPSVD